MSKDDLIGYVLDASDPAEHAAIEQRLERDPKLRQRVEEIRQTLVPLAADDPIPVPEGLAERTIAFVFGRRRISATQDAPACRSTWRPVDLAVASGILAIAAAMVIPAIAALHGDHDRLLCAERLRSLGVALAMYGQFENGHLPYVAPEGPLNNAGVFASLLKSRDLLTDVRQLICPSSNNSVVIVPTMEQYLAEQLNLTQLDRLRRLMAGSYGYVMGFANGEAHSGVRLPSGSQIVLADRPCRASEQATPLGNSPNHADLGQNVLFADGAVRWLASRVYAGDDIYANQAGRAAAGVGRQDTCLGVSEAVPYPAGAESTPADL